MFAFMEYGELKSALVNHNLRVTNCRLDVLERLMSSDHALSSKDLEETLDQYDRVTLYRTLHAFEECGMVHSIPDDSGFARYGLCQDTCGPEAHKHNHVHFKCLECGQLECLNDQMVPTISVPGYHVSEANLILSGTCKECAA